MLPAGANVFEEKVVRKSREEDRDRVRGTTPQKKGEKRQKEGKGGSGRTRLESGMMQEKERNGSIEKID